jgi:prolyl-tRNA synthetase
MVGGIIMTHGDDIGLLPPRVAPIQVVIVPIWKKDEQTESIMATALQVGLKKTDVCVKLDATEKKTPGWKFNFWEMEGVRSKIRGSMRCGRE